MGLRCLWVCGSEGSVGLWLWVSARSGGLRARVHGGSGGLSGLLERKCEEKRRTESAKARLWENFRSFLGPFWKKRTEKESTGPKRAFRRFSEVPSTTQCACVFKFGLSWGPSGQVSGAFRKLFRAILGSIAGTIERRKQKGRRSLPLEPARAGSTLARSETDEKATQKRLKTRPR